MGGGAVGAAMLAGVGAVGSGVNRLAAGAGGATETGGVSATGGGMVALGA